jgi:hypothetical protein
VPGAALNLLGALHGAHLGPGARLGVALTESGWCGKYWGFAIGTGGATVNATPLFLAPGQTVPVHGRSSRRCLPPGS